MSAHPLIGGKARPTTARAIHSPWDGSVVSTVGFCEEPELKEALESAERGFGETKKLPRHERAAILERMADCLFSERDHLARTILEESGKPLQFARGEVARCEQTFRRFAEATRSLTEASIPLDAVAAGEGRIGLMDRFPLGPILGITPFNFPLNLVAHKMAPAIATGCSFLIKPAEQTPTSAIQLGQIAQKCGFPDSAINVVPADRSVVRHLVDSEIPKLLSFTGSAEVGWALKTQAGQKKVTLELGGNAAVILHSDADLARAIPAIATAGMAYAGQVCISVQRILIHESIYEEARSQLFAALSKIPTGDPSQASTICGPMISHHARERLKSWVQEAVAEGASIAFSQEQHPNPAVLPPMALEHVNPHCKIYAEEAFGPVVILESYRDMEEAIHSTNQGRWGLQTGLFTEDIQTLFMAYQQLEVGALLHNDVPTRRVDHMPYGGIKDSGLGREGPLWAMRDYTEPKMLSINWTNR